MSLRKNKTLLVLCALTVLVFQGCSSPETPAAPERELLFKRERLYTVDVPNTLSTIVQYYQPRGSGMIYFLDPASAALHEMNTSTGHLRLKGTFPALKDYDSFTVDEHKKAVHIWYTDSLVTYSFRGKRIARRDLHHNNLGGWTFVSNAEYRPVLKNGNIYIAFFPAIKGDFKNPAYFREPIEAVVDLKTNNARLLPHFYPANYQQHCYGFNYDASRMETDAFTHGYTFPHNDSIFLYDIRTGAKIVRFFGSKTDKQFEYIPFEKISSLNESVFMELVQKNPHYGSPVAAPLAGYFFRELISMDENGSFHQRFVLFDRDFAYVGESAQRPNFVVDSKQGLLSMQMNDTHILFDKLSW